jgi:hypothetical protein
MTTRHQFLREVLELTKQRMMSRVVANASSSIPNSSSISLSTELTTNENLVGIVLGLVYIFIMIAFSSRSYNRFGFMMNEESESESESESPVSLRPTLSGKYLQTPLQSMNAITPKTPAPLRRSLRLKIKSELNICAMQNNSATMITRSQIKQNQAMTISSDPCPHPYNRGSMTTPSHHPEHDEERAYYIRYCNEKKMRKQRPEFNSPLFVRRLVL